MEPLIVFDGVSYWYPNAGQPALRNVSLKVPQGEFLLVVGSSGSGKSTLLRSINGLVPHFTGGRFRGDVTVCGHSTRRTPLRVLARCVGSVFQDPENQFIMSEVTSELVFGLENLGLGRDEIERRMREVAEYFELAGLYGRRVHERSSGEKQRVVLASVLAMKPAVLVLDEPTSQLDPAAAEDFLYFLRRLHEEFSMTVVLAEHRIDRVLPFIDRVFDLDSGRLGSPEDILPNSVNAPPIIQLSQRLHKKNIDIGNPRSLQDARGRIENSGISFTPKSWLVRPLTAEKIASIKDLTAAFNGRRVLDSVSIDLYRGQFTALMGKNGAGKTTLVKHLNGLLKAAEGTVMVLSLDVSTTSVEQMAHLVGFVSQNPNDYLFQETVLKELDFTAENLGIPCDADRILTPLGLAGLRNAYPRDLSGGERQRVALASVLVGDPELIILDEPTRGMDASSKQRLTGLLMNLCVRGKTILLVTHDVEFAASSAERVIVLDGGKVVADGAAHAVLNECELFMPQVSQIFPGKNYLTVEDAMEGLK